MAYTKEIYEKAAEELERRRQKATDTAERHRKEIAARFPDLLLLESEMAAASLDVVRAVANGSDATAIIGKLSKRNLELQNERRLLIAKAGYPADYLEPAYTCKACRDKGILDGKFCACHLQLLKKLSYDALSGKSPLKLSRFSDFDLSYYPEEKENGVSPRQRMTEIFEFCRDYAEDFDCASPSIYMYGETGLGKTHLSLAIAGEAIEKGFGVVYGSAQNLLSKLEREKFGSYGESASATEDLLLQCDLLVLDDLGAEFSTKFTVSAIYNIINSRMAAGLPTIISSNITLDEMRERYTSRVVSRIIGTYVMLEFVGSDVRQLK